MNIVGKNKRSCSSFRNR